MEGKKKGYAWAVSAGLNAALAAFSAKLITPQILRYGMVVLFNVTMWGCYVNSLKALSSLQASATNFAVNFLSSGLAAFFLFQEPLSFKEFEVSGTQSKTQRWFAGAMFIVVGSLVLSKSSIEKKTRTD